MSPVVALGLDNGFADTLPDKKPAVDTTDLRGKAEGDLANRIRNLRLVHRTGNPTSRKDLEKLALESFDSILILADEELEATDNSFDMVYADSRSLTCLLLIRDIIQQRRSKSAQESSEKPRSAALLSEILDPRTKSLISVGTIGDYVTSNELVSHVSIYQLRCK